MTKISSGFSMDLQTELNKIRAKNGTINETNINSIKTAIAKDGLVDDSELEFLKSLTSQDGSIKYKDGDQEFSLTANFKTPNTDLINATTLMAKEKLQNMSLPQRNELMKKIDSINELKQLLTADQELIGQENKWGYTKGDNTGIRNAKVLMQDATLLQKMGLLDENDMAVLTKMINNGVTADNISGLLGNKIYENGKLKQATPELVALDKIIEKVITKLDESPTLITLNSESINSLGKEDVPLEDQYKIISNNLNALGAECDAAMNDAKVAGLSGNRDPGLMVKCSNVLGEKVNLINTKMLPSLQNYMQSLGSQINELKSKPDFSESNPQYLALMSKYSVARNMYTSLCQKVSDMTTQQIETLKKCECVTAVQGNTNARLQDGSKVVGDLAKASISLQSINQELNSIMEGNLVLWPDDKNTTAKDFFKISQLTPKMIDDFAKGLGDKGADFIAQLKTKNPNADLVTTLRDMEIKDDKIKAAAQSIKSEQIKTKLEGVRNNTLSSLNNLLASYEKYSQTQDGLATVDPKVKGKTIALIKQQIESIKSLNMEDPKAAVAKLENSRNEIVTLLKGMGPKLIDPKEVEMLESIDKGVTNVSGSYMDATGNYNSIRSDVHSRLTKLETTKADIEERMKFLDKLDEHIGWDTGIQLNLGIGISWGIKFAKVGVGIEGGLTVKKDFSADPAYIMQFDASFKLYGELDIGIAEFEAEIKQTWGAGLAFSTLNDAKNFAASIGGSIDEVMQIVKDVKDKKITTEGAKAKINAITDKTVKIIQEHFYTSSETSAKVMGKIGKIEGELQTATTTVTGKYTTVTTDKIRGHVKIGEFGLDVLRQDSKSVSNSDPTKVVNASRTSIEIELPPQLLSLIFGTGTIAGIAGTGLSGLPEDVKNSILEELSKSMVSTGPVMALDEARKVFATLDETLKANTGTIKEMQRLQKFNAGFESNMTIGVDIICKEGHLHEVSATVGFEAKASVDISIPVGAGFNVDAWGSASLKAVAQFPIIKVENN